MPNLHLSPVVLGPKVGERWHCSFVNPQSGDIDHLWFDTQASREAFIAGYQGDFPTMADTVSRWYTSDEQTIAESIAIMEMQA